MVLSDLLIVSCFKAYILGQRELIVSPIDFDSDTHWLSQCATLLYNVVSLSRFALI